MEFKGNVRLAFKLVYINIFKLSFPYQYTQYVFQEHIEEYIVKILHSIVINDGHFS